MIYLDNAATTQPSREAIAGSAFAMTQAYGNPSSLHGMGVKAEKLVNFTKEKLAAALGGQPQEIIITSGATESNNLAIFGLAEVYGRRRKKIVTTAVEHPSILEPMKRLAERGFELTIVRPNENGEITEDSLVQAVDENTCLISAMYVNNETGYILPIEGAFARIKRLYPDCITHSDCVQAFMKLPFRARSISADAISVSGHKVHAPKGIGALYLKKGVRIAPQLLGGGQQNGLRSGTEPVPAIYAFGKAVEALAPTINERLEHAQKIREYAIRELQKIPDVVINSSPEASPYIISAALLGIKSETVLHFLEQRSIYVSSGSACSKGKKSSVLEAFSLPRSVIDSTIRISTSAATAQEEIDELCKGLKAAGETLAKIKK